MSEIAGPLTIPSQVERAVLDAGLYDMELAHGAGLIADSSRFDLLYNPESVDGSVRSVRGVTVISQSRSNDTTFRTATFGMSSQANIAQAEALGSGMVIDLGVPSDKSPRLNKAMNLGIVKQSLFASLNERGHCTLGGAVTFSGDEKHTIMTLPFITNSLLDHLIVATNDTRSAKVGNFIRGLRFEEARQEKQKFEEGTGPDPRKLAALRVFSYLVSSAVQRPGGPVVVDRPFAANL